jgi:hypothetical protein
MSVHPLTTLPKPKSKLISKDINIIFYDRCNLDVLKGKPIKFLKMNKTPCQAFKTCVFEKKKIATYMDL